MIGLMLFVSNKINFSPEEAATPEALAERLETICDTFLIAEIDGTVADYIEGPVISERYLTDDLFYKVTPNASQGGYIAVTSLSISKDFKMARCWNILDCSFSKTWLLLKNVKGLA